MNSLQLFAPNASCHEALDPRDHDPLDLIRLAEARGLSSQHVRRWLTAVMARDLLHPEAWSKLGILPKRFLETLAPLPRLQQEKIQTSATDGFKKILFRTPDGFPVETVIIPLHKGNAATICLSSQVGCVMGCAFCATARMKERRNLATWEIIDQFTQARALARAAGREPTGVVFMGMGEPFLNYDKVLAAAELLRFPILQAISGKAITVSTVGLVRQIDRFTDEARPFRLSISLGAATDEKRLKLVPVAARTPVREVMAAARRHALTLSRRIMLAYVCIAGENMTVDDARTLGDLISDTPVRLDLIEVTDTSGRFTRPGAAEMDSFRDALTRYVRQPIVRRYSGGADINAACGTLSGAS